MAATWIAGASEAQAQPPSCPAITAPPTDLETPNKYGGGRAQDQISAAAANSYEATRGPLNKTRDTINGLSQKLLAAPSGPSSEHKRVSACLISQLDKMARARSLTGKLSGQASDLRTFILPTLAIGYLAARPQAQDGDARKRIEAWLGALLAGSIRREDARALVGNSQLHPHMINNHYYWTGYGALLVGVATNDAEAFGWGRRAILRGLDQIDAEGFLAPEVARETRALSYHAFALQPLSMGALILAANGQPVSTEQMRALARLGDLTMSGLTDPGAFSGRMAERADTRRFIRQVEVPKTPPALPILLMLTGRTPALSTMDARVRCYPTGPIGPGPGVWSRADALRTLRNPSQRPTAPRLPLQMNYKLCS